MWQYNYIGPPNELYHYGVLGMKWGVRHDKERTGSKRQKTKENTSLAKTKSKHRQNLEEKYLSKGYSKKEAELAADKRIKAEKVIAIAAGVTVATCVAYYGYRKVKINKETEKRLKDLTTREIDSKLKFVKKRDIGSIEDDLKAINPGGPNSLGISKTKGTTQNCTFCTTAYELRRRGYDVVANKTDSGRTITHASDFFKNAKIEDDSLIPMSLTNPSGYGRANIKEITKKLESHGPGARGNLCGQYFFGGGHSIIWEVENNGKVVFRDGQTGKTYKDAKKALGYFKAGGTQFWRTDNLEINTNTIHEAVSSIGKQRTFNNAMEYDSEISSEMRKAVLRYKRANNVSLEEARRAVQKYTKVKGL